VDFSNTLLNKVKTAYKIAGTIPKLFVKDLDLLTEEALFIEKNDERLEFNPKLCIF
jgi:hypothetical protein